MDGKKKKKKSQLAIGGGTKLIVVGQTELDEDDISICFPQSGLMRQAMTKLWMKKSLI